MTKALLLIDIQNDYFSGGKNELFEPLKALDNALVALTAFRTANLPVIHVQHISTQTGATFFIPDTHGAEIHDALAPQANEHIVIKQSPNSFFETNLNEIINESRISELIVCGMMTHMCVDTTVRAAKDYAIPVTLLADACATKNLSFNGKILSAYEINKVYFASLNNMFAKIISTNELCI